MSKEQILLRVTEDLNARIEAEAGSKQARAEWIRELIREEVGPDTEANPDAGNYPEKERDRKIYEALLNHGEDAVLKGYVRLDDVKPEIAQETQVGKDAIYQSLKRMERNNHVRLDHGRYAGDPIRVRARPPSADPELWTRAKDRRRKVDPAVFRVDNGRADSSAKAKLLEEIEAGEENNATEVRADD